jgi:histidinol-phosphate aminotransferase
VNTVDPPLEWFPTQRAMWRLPSRQRPHQPDVLNLKSCELLQPRVLDWFQERLTALRASEIVAYPTTQAAIGAVAGYCDRPTNEVMLSPGTDHAIRVVCEALCAPAGRLVIADPHFDGWSRYATQYGFRLHAVAMPDHSPMTVAALVDAMHDGGQAVVVLTQPDGITGQLYGRDEVAELAAAVEAHGSVLVLDTCYLAFADGGASTITTGRNVVRINSFSKSFGLAGARVGAVLADPPMLDYLARWSAEGMISGLSLRLLILALDDPATFDAAWNEVRVARGVLEAGLAEWRSRPSGANFVAFDLPPDDARDVHASLLSSGIRTRLLSGLPGFPGGIRISSPSLVAVDRVLAATPFTRTRGEAMT